MEEDRDNFADKFSEALFNYLWYTERAVTDTKIAEAIAAAEDSWKVEQGFENVLQLVSQSAKAVVIMSILSLRDFNKSVVDYFARFGISRLSVFTFLSKYCFVHHAAKNDIFEVVLHTFSMTYRLAVFCRKMGHKEFIGFAAMCWNEIFDVDLKEDFYDNGGWREFRMYVAESLYASKDGDADQRVLAGFLENFNDLFLKMEQEIRNAKTSYHDSGKTMNGLQKLSEDPQPGSKASESKPVIELVEYSFGEVASLIPDINKKMRGMVFSFIIANLKIEQLLKESESEPSEQSNLPVGESSHNPELDADKIEDTNQECLSLKITENDRSPIEHNSKSVDEVAAGETISEPREDSKETLV